MSQALDDAARERLRLAFRECGTLMYADHQLLKAGEYAALLDRLKSRWSMKLTGWFAMLCFVYWQYRDEQGGLLGPFGLLLMGTALVSALWFVFLRRRIAAAARLVADLTGEVPQTS